MNENEGFRGIFLVFTIFTIISSTFLLHLHVYTFLLLSSTITDFYLLRFVQLFTFDCHLISFYFQFIDVSMTLSLNLSGPLTVVFYGGFYSSSYPCFSPSAVLLKRLLINLRVQGKVCLRCRRDSSLLTSKREYFLT